MIRAEILRAVALDRLIVELIGFAVLRGIVVYKILGNGLELDFIFLSESIDRIARRGYSEEDCCEFEKNDALRKDIIITAVSRESS